MHAAARLQRADGRAAQALRDDQGARLLVRRQGPVALPRQRLPAARRDRRWRSARSRTRSCRSRSSACRRSSRDFTTSTKGLVLVTGPTGSGKSTTLAAMIDQINATRQAPHHHDRGPDRVRPPPQEVHRQPARGRTPTPSRSPTALKYVLRQDPDVILIGEMRDLETIAAALTIAETGHLVLRDAAHQLDLRVDQPHRRRVPAGPAAADPHPARVRARGRGDAAADPARRGRGPGDGAPRCWSARRRSRR